MLALLHDSKSLCFSKSAITSKPLLAVHTDIQQMSFSTLYLALCTTCSSYKLKAPDVSSWQAAAGAEMEQQITRGAHGADQKQSTEHTWGTEPRQHCHMHGRHLTVKAG